MEGSARSSTSEMIECDDCGKHVPASDLTIHKLRACQGNRKRSSRMDGTDQQSRTGGEETVIPMDIDDADGNDNSALRDIQSKIPAHQNSNNPVVPSISSESPTSAMAALRRRRRARVAAGEGEDRENNSPNTSNQEESNNSDDDDGVLQVGDIIDLVNEDTHASSSARSSAATAREPSDDGNNTNDESTKDEWPCPQCTLLNPMNEPYCGACRYRNTDVTRAPDAVRTEQLIGDSPTSPLMFVGGGAVMGGLLGAAGSLMRGRSVLSGAAEGGMTGAVGGAFLQEVLRTSNDSDYVTNAATASSFNSIAQARSSAANGMAAYPSMGSDSDRQSRRRPRSSFRVVQSHGPNGETTTIVTGGNGTTRITRASSRMSAPQIGTSRMDDPLFSLMFHSMLQERGGTSGGGMANPDGMSYEQLLQAFGDGTDNMGAEESQIRRLPERVLGDPAAELPEDARQCLICLDDFERGETRKILPCLHGFHGTCCGKREMIVSPEVFTRENFTIAYLPPSLFLRHKDKWLRTNGSCPICKHKIA